MKAINLHSIKRGENAPKTFIYLFTLLVSLFMTQSMSAATITSNAVVGRWDATGSWVGGIVPTATDDVVIATGAVITIRDPYNLATPALCNSLTINGTLTMGSGSGSLRSLSVTTFIMI